MSRLHFTYDYTNHTYTVCNADSSEAGANSASFMEFQGVLADFKDNEKTSLRKNIPFALQILKSTNTKDLPTIDSLISQMRSTTTSSITDV